MLLKKYFLILAALTVVPIGLLYGYDPEWFVAKFFNTDRLTVDFKHVLRAMMCLYLAFGAFWLYAAFKEQHRNTALLSTIVFAGGLFIGRLLSFFMDGRASDLLSFYAILELGLLPVALWIYKRSD